jgi:hypothetical protein
MVALKPFTFHEQIFTVLTAKRWRTSASGASHPGISARYATGFTFEAVSLPAD